MRRFLYIAIGLGTLLVVLLFNTGEKAPKSGGL